MRSFLEGVGVADDPVAQRAARRPTLSAARAAASRSSTSAAAPAAGSTGGRLTGGRDLSRGSRPRGDRRARVTRGYAVIFRRGWRCGRPRSSAGGAAADRIGGPGGSITVVDLGGGPGGRLTGGRLTGGRDSVPGVAPARRSESEGNAGLCGHF